MNAPEDLYRKCLKFNDYGRVQVKISPEIYLLYSKFNAEERKKVREAWISSIERDILLIAAGKKQ